MREVISVHVGQAGVQLGSICWRLYCLEHGLNIDGTFIGRDQSLTSANLRESFEQMNVKEKTDFAKNGPSEGFYSFFSENANGNYSPRAVFLDLEPSVIDTIRRGDLKSLFLPTALLNECEDAANNYARGFYACGTKVINRMMDCIRKMAEASEKLQGFMTFHSFGGGTGSGLHALLNEHLANEYNKSSVLDSAIFTSPTLSTSVVEPYNAVLSTSRNLLNTSCVFLADNEAMYNICQSKLEIDSPTYKNLNHLLAQTISSITASIRFQGTLNSDFTDFQTNLVPFPRIHFPVISYAPIISEQKVSRECMSVSEMTSTCFENSNRLVKCENEQGKYMACCILYRGDVLAKDVNQAIHQIKGKKGVKFVPWSPTGFKVGINDSIPCTLKDSENASSTKAVCLICNTTAIKEAWSILNYKYHIMLKKRAFTHWFLGEGMDDSEFYDAQDNLLTLEQEYDVLNVEN
ncbi:tubulin alpha-8 chain-like [Rhodnius prolixus]